METNTCLTTNAYVSEFQHHLIFSYEPIVGVWYDRYVSEGIMCVYMLMVYSHLKHRHVNIIVSSVGIMRCILFVDTLYTVH